MGPTIKRVTSVAPVEINPAKQPGFLADQIEGSGTTLEELSQEIFDRLAAFKEFPVGVRTIANIIYTEVEAKFPDCGQDVLVTVIFLRLLCPAIVSPWVFGLTDKAPHPLYTRSLILVSKLIQMTCAASGVRRCIVAYSVSLKHCNALLVIAQHAFSSRYSPFFSTVSAFTNTSISV